ncbi:MAG: urease accessory protein UreD [Myxococcales bacterium]|nr:urease accessory protein UreD [Myxococcales bacterium]MCB9642378.1 urease accessory protein UreD [Myxococcales bacterium]
MNQVSKFNLSTQTERHWPAFLSLGFDEGMERTCLRQMAFQGPLRVQRPFYPEGEVCHVYLLHPPGGLVSGDDLQVQVTCAERSHALLTTPSAGKIYRADSQGGAQRQQVRIRVEDACCEWMPMETIIFDGAHARLSTRVDLYGDARFVGLDVFCLGRPKSGLPFLSGSVEQRLAIYHQDRPLLLERQYLAADDPLFRAMSGFHTHLVSGTLVIAGLQDPQMGVEQLRAHLGTQQTTLSVTQRMGVIVVRYLGDCSEQALQQLRDCWQRLRPLLLGKAPCLPRIWNT